MMFFLLSFNSFCICMCSNAVKRVIPQCIVFSHPALTCDGDEPSNALIRCASSSNISWGGYPRQGFDVHILHFITASGRSWLGNSIISWSNCQSPYAQWKGTSTTFTIVPWSPTRFVRKFQLVQFENSQIKRKGTEKLSKIESQWLTVLCISCIVDYHGMYWTFICDFLWLVVKILLVS